MDCLIRTVFKEEKYALVDVSSCAVDDWFNSSICSERTKSYHNQEVYLRSLPGSRRKERLFKFGSGGLVFEKQQRLLGHLQQS